VKHPRVNSQVASVTTTPPGGAFFCSLPVMLVATPYAAQWRSSSGLTGPSVAWSVWIATRTASGADSRIVRRTDPTWRAIASPHRTARSGSFSWACG
jgi:hypothetical protein